MKNFNLLVFLLFAMITTGKVYASDFKRELRIGETVFLKEKNSFVKIQSFSDGAYTVMFTSGANTGKTGRGWLRSDLALIESCTLKLCTGAIVHDQKLKSNAEVIAIDIDGDLVIKVSENQILTEVSEPSVAIITSNKFQASNSPNNNTSQLSYNRELQIGDEVIIVEVNLKGIVKEKENGTYNIRITEGNKAGQIGRGWLRSDLALTRACNGSMCTQQKYLFKKENLAVYILAIDSEGYFVVANSLENNQALRWKNVNIRELAKIESSQAPASPIVEKPNTPIALPPVANSPNNNTSQLNYNRELQIGDEVIIVEVNLKGIVKEKENGTYNIRITEGNKAGQIGRGWLRSDLALTRACNGSMCTQQKYLFKKENLAVYILAIDSEGYFVVANSLENNQALRWKNVNIRELAKIESSQAPASPIVEKPNTPIALPPVANSPNNNTSQLNYIDLPIK